MCNLASIEIDLSSNIYSEDEKTELKKLIALREEQNRIVLGLKKELQTLSNLYFNLSLVYELIKRAKKSDLHHVSIDFGGITLSFRNKSKALELINERRETVKNQLSVQKRLVAHEEKNFLETNNKILAIYNKANKTNITLTQSVEKSREMKYKEAEKKIDNLIDEIKRSLNKKTGDSSGNKNRKTAKIAR